MKTNDAVLTLVGGPTVIIDVAGFRLVTDPTFDPPQDYPLGAVLLEKTAGPALQASELGCVDAVLLSHDQHLDNLDISGRAMLATARVTYTTIAGAQRIGGNSKGLADFETVRLSRENSPDLIVTAAPARHGPIGIEPISGQVIGFLVGLNAPGDAIYVTGDTVWYEGTAEIARRYAPNIVIVFAGSAEPRGTFHMTMNTNDVIATAHAFPDAKIVAVHNHGWAHFKESGQDLVRAFGALGLAHRLNVIAPGKPAPFALA